MILPASLRLAAARWLLPASLFMLPLPGLLPSPAAAQDRQAREALVLAEGLGHLGAALRAYGQLGQQVNESEAAALLARAREEFDTVMQQLLRRGGKRLAAGDGERLSQRWRSVRDATYTRPSPVSGALMAFLAEEFA